MVTPAQAVHQEHWENSFEPDGMTLPVTAHIHGHINGKYSQCVKHMVEQYGEKWKSTGEERKRRSGAEREHIIRREAQLSQFTSKVYG